MVVFGIPDPEVCIRDRHRVGVVQTGVCLGNTFHPRLQPIYLFHQVVSVNQT
jgi:hypothetical protein